MEYHLFRRRVGNKVQWYYWYYEINKKQVRRSCGSNGKPCYTKREAEKFIAELKEKDRLREEKLKSDKLVKLNILFNEMYREGSTYLKLQEAHGNHLLPQTIKQKIRIFNKHINPIWGERLPESIQGVEIENWLIDLSLSNASKNNILSVFNEIFDECRRNQIISNVPKVQSFRRNTKKKDILSFEEIQKLFPEDLALLTKIFETDKIENYFGVDGVCHSYGILFGIMFILILTAGLRVGEVAAISEKQLTNNGLILDRMIDSEKKLQMYLKKGSEDNTKARAVVIPKRVHQLLQYYLTIKPNCDKDFLFTYRGDFVKKEMIESRFRLALKNCDINQDKKRWITPHSLRFTYNTYMVHSQFPQDMLRKMIGHTSQEMTDYYTRSNLESELSGLSIYQQQVDDLWN